MFDVEDDGYITVYETSINRAKILTALAVAHNMDLNQFTPEVLSSGAVIWSKPLDKKSRDWLWARRVI